MGEARVRAFSGLAIGLVALTSLGCVDRCEEARDSAAQQWRAYARDQRRLSIEASTRAMEAATEAQRAVNEGDSDSVLRAAEVLGARAQSQSSTHAGWAAIADSYVDRLGANVFTESSSNIGDDPAAREAIEATDRAEAACTD